MFSDLFDRLLGTSQQDPLTANDARLALVALLVRIARSDGDYAQAESNRIDRIAMTRYILSKEEAIALRQQAENLEAQAPDTVRFTRAIKEVVPYEDRVKVVEALWQVVLADGQRDPEEDALMRMLVNFLGIGDIESARIRQRLQSLE